MSAASGRSFITTARAGALLGVSPPTVIGWIRRGLLRAHLTPGGHRRIDPADLFQFAAQQGLHLKELTTRDDSVGEGAAEAVLLWDSERDYAETVAEFIAIGLGMKTVVVDDVVALSFWLGRVHPHAVLVEWGLLEPPALAQLRDLGGDSTRWIACLPIGDPGLSTRAMQAGFQQTVHRGQPMHSVVEVLRG